MAPHRANQRRGSRSPASSAVAPAPQAAIRPPRHQQARQTPAVSFNDLVGDREQRRWDLDAKCAGRFQIDHELELGRLLHGHITGFLALEYTAGVDSDLPESLGYTGTV